VVAGWAADLSDFRRKLQVLLVVDGRPAAFVDADVSRHDLKVAGIGDGSHGFELATPNLRAQGVGKVEAFALRRETARRLGLLDGGGRLARGIDAARFDRILRSARNTVARIGAVETREPDYAARPEHRRGRGPVAFLDIHDLLVFLEENTRVTGIQRVVLGLVKTSLSDPSRYHAFEFCILTHRGDVIVLPRPELLAFAERALAGDVDQGALREGVAVLRTGGLRVETRPGDRCVATGAYWIVDEYGKALLRLRAKGVRIGAYVYDLIPITHGPLVTASTREVVIERALELFAVCDFFLAISRFVERELRGILANEMGRRPVTSTVPLPHELPGGEMSAASGEPAHPRPFVLCVGTLEARKNQLLLFDVWAALIRKHGAHAVPDLVLVGRWGWRSEELRALCEETEFLSGRIVVKAGVSDAELAALYGACLFTAFPSFLEGWGLPVGESLAAGKLCVAADATSVPEVGGDFVDYIGPHDRLSAFDVIERAIFDETHRADRERQIAASFRARSWQDTTDAFHAAVEALTAEVEERKVPLLEAGVSYPFENLMSDMLRSWRHKAAKLALIEGWHDQEPWGAWAGRPNATLRFFADAAPGETVTVTLRLVLPPDVAESEVRLQSGTAGRVVRLRGREAQDVELDARAGEGGEMEITLHADLSGMFPEGMRELYVGLAGIGVGVARPRADVQAKAPTSAS
jgi:glycosyltransferase involved in cell wall biosynthesis